jgi:colicin import membrane protein
VSIPPFAPHNEPGLRPLALSLTCSLVLHAAALLLFSGFLSGPAPVEQRPVYFVDLTKMPVLNPQAGRPDGGPAPKGDSALAPAPPQPDAPKAADAPSEPSSPEPRPAASTDKAASKATVSSPGAKPAASATRPAASAAPATGDYNSVQDKLAAMRERQQRQQELAALKNRIAALSGGGAGSATGGSGSGYGSGAPLGMPDGTGTEAGVDQQTWLQAYLKDNWSLSKYQITRRDLSATVRLAFSADGSLISYHFIDSSGDATFDDSVKRAILKAKTLPFQPQRQIQLDVVFNLKDLMD